MLALATLAAVLALTPKPALAPGVHPPCPSGVEATLTATARVCPALEVSGRVDADGAELEPAFTTLIDPSELARFGPGDAVLSGFSSDGRTIFVLPVQAGAAFHLYIPLAPQALQALARLTLVSGNVSAERLANTRGEPNAEVISVDDGQLLIVWDAQAFPAVRVATGPGLTPIAFGNGTSTFEQLTVATTARQIFVEFSDGIHTVRRSYNVFGR